jgi:hypothetical protein
MKAAVRFRIKKPASLPAPSSAASVNGVPNTSRHGLFVVGRTTGNRTPVSAFSARRLDRLSYGPLGFRFGLVTVTVTFEHLSGRPNHPMPTPFVNIVLAHGGLHHQYLSLERFAPTRIERHHVGDELNQAILAETRRNRGVNQRFE